MQAAISFPSSIELNILTAMQPQPSQNMYVQSTVANSSSQVRSNQVCNLYRGAPVIPGSRSGTRHVPMQALYPQTMHQGVQSVLMQPFSQYQRHTFQAPSYAQYTQQMQPNYPYPYSSYYSVPTQRGSVGVNNSVGVSNTIPVQPGSSGPIPGPAGNVTTASNPGILGVAPSPNGPQPSTQSVSGVVPNTVSSHLSQKATRRRAHALEIIDPNTNKNILDDFDKNKTSSSSEIEYPEQKVYIQQPIIMGDQLRNLQYDLMDMQPVSREVNLGHTPIVSAISDGPSIEILPLTQKICRNKRALLIVNPNDGNIVQNEATELNEQILHHSAGCKESEPVLKSDCTPEHILSVIQSQCQCQHSSYRMLPQSPKRKNENVGSNISKECAYTDNNYRKAELTTVFTGIKAVPNDSKSQQVEDINSSVWNVAEVTEATGMQELDNQKESDTNFPFNENIASGMSVELFDEATIKNQIGSELRVSSEDLQKAPANTDLFNIKIAQIVFPVVKENISNSTVNVSQIQNMITENPPVTTDVVKKGDNDLLTSIDGSHSLKSDKITAINQNISRDPVLTIGGNGFPQMQPPQHHQTENVVNNAYIYGADRLSNAPKHVSDNIKTTPDQFFETTNASLQSLNISLTTGKAESNATLSAKQLDVSVDKSGFADTNNFVNNLPNTISAFTEQEGSLNLEGGDMPIPQQYLISYNKDQWSPRNPSGKKQYGREQLLQLRVAKASVRQPDVNNMSILPTPNLLPSFVRYPKRVQSMLGSLNINRNTAGSLFGGDCGGYFESKQTSMPGMKGVFRVNLSLNQDVKLNETENAWRPRVLTKGSDIEVSPEVKAKREKEELICRVRGILNKLTPEKFDALVEEIIKLKIDTPDKMEDVMVLVFEKAIDEPNFSVSYARLCHRLITEVKARDERMESGTKTNLAQFRAALIDKTEREFTQNVTKNKAKEKKLQPIIDKISKCTEPTEKAELELQLEEEERKLRRRSGGTVRFIGELFKISMLNGRIINSCIDALLNPDSEDQLECLCKLLTTVGSKFEQTPINAKESIRLYSLEKTISRMQAIAEKTDKEGGSISSRVRFMLQDVIDLRREKWQSKRNETPKTMGQVEKEMKTEQFFNFSGSAQVGSSGCNISSGSLSSGTGSKRDERSGRYNELRLGYGGNNSQRNDIMSSRRLQSGDSSGHGSVRGANMNSSSDDNIWHVQTSKGSRCLDTNKLEGLATANNFDTKKMGGVSQFIWSTGSRQSSNPALTPTNSFAVLSALSDINKSSEKEQRNGPRNKGSYHKGSMEHDRYGMLSRLGSQISKESSSSRDNHSSRSAIQKPVSNCKYLHQEFSSSGVTSKVPAFPLYPKCGIDLYTNCNQPTNSRSKNSLELPIAVFQKSSESEKSIFKSVVSEMLEIVSNCKTPKNFIEPCIQRLKESQRSALLYYIMTYYLHLRQIGKLHRRYLGNIVAYLIQTNYMSHEHFILAYKEFCETASDLELDIPDLWKYIIEFTGPLVSKRLLTIYDIWDTRFKEDAGKKFLKTFLDYCLSEIGPSFTRSMWKKTGIKWCDFMADNEIKSFQQANKYEYIEDGEIQPHIVVNEPKEDCINRVSENVEHLLKEEATAETIIDYINGNFVETDKHFIRNLTTKLCDFAILYKDNCFKLETNCFQKICIPILHRYIDSREEFELECLYSMQLLVARLEHPRGLLSDLFGELYDADVIPQDSFIKWRDSKEQSAGKGVAVKGLNPFFYHILNSETSDENN